ncbi:hypothetical protein A2U01_0118552, partial [Trifolium medium]|nr:hypothetical protein [Trifolium medium]
DLAEDLNYAAG